MPLYGHYITTVYFLNAYISYKWNIFAQVSSPMCILAKATEMTTGVWQQVKRSCSDKRSIYREENKTKEKLSTLVNTRDSFFCSFIINDDANIASFCY